MCYSCATVVIFHDYKFIMLWYWLFICYVFILNVLWEEKPGGPLRKHLSFLLFCICLFKNLKVISVFSLDSFTHKLCSLKNLICRSELCSFCNLCNGNKFIYPHFSNRSLDTSRALIHGKVKWIERKRAL